MFAKFGRDLMPKTPGQPPLAWAISLKLDFRILFYDPVDGN